MSGLLSARAASSQAVSTVPAKGAASRRTQVVETTGLAAVASAKVRAGPARATVRAPSVKVATQAPFGVGDDGARRVGSLGQGVGGRGDGEGADAGQRGRRQQPAQEGAARRAAPVRPRVGTLCRCAGAAACAEVRQAHHGRLLSPPVIPVTLSVVHAHAGALGVSPRRAGLRNVRFVAVRRSVYGRPSGGGIRRIM